MRATSKEFKKFIEEIHKALPQGFEADISNEGLTNPATAYAFVAFMRGGSAKNCARDFEAKLGIEDEDEVDMDDTTINGWTDEGGSI